MCTANQASCAHALCEAARVLSSELVLAESCCQLVKQAQRYTSMHIAQQYPPGRMPASAAAALCLHHALQHSLPY